MSGHDRHAAFHPREQVRLQAMYMCTCALVSLKMQRTSLAGARSKAGTHVATHHSAIHHQLHDVMQHVPVQAQQFLDGKLQPYDFAFSYSSIEHSGLGRYGASSESEALASRRSTDSH